MVAVLVVVGDTVAPLEAVHWYVPGLPAVNADSTTLLLPQYSELLERRLI